MIVIVLVIVLVIVIESVRIFCTPSRRRLRRRGPRLRAALRAVLAATHIQQGRLDPKTKTPVQLPRPQSHVRPTARAHHRAADPIPQGLHEAGRCQRRFASLAG